MVAPDGKIRLGHPGVSAQQKDYCMRLRDQIHGQLWLGTYRIQTGRVQNHQALPQQRVGHIDQRMAPHGHFHPAVGINHGVVCALFVMPEAPGSGLLLRYLAHLGHLGQGIGNLLRIGNIQRVLLPGIAAHTPLPQALGRLTRAYGQKPQTRRQRRVPAQLCRAHGGAPSACRHEAATIVSKKDGVDQLGLAARELGHKGHHDLVITHLLHQPLQTLLHRRVQQIMRRQPLPQFLQLRSKTAPPGTMLVKLLIE